MTAGVFDLDAWAVVARVGPLVSDPFPPPYAVDGLGRTWCADCAAGHGVPLPAALHRDPRAFDTRDEGQACDGCGRVFVFVRRARNGDGNEAALNDRLRAAWALGWRGGDL